MINAWAERIHLGVYYQHSVGTPLGGVAKDAISKNAILLASMVDTLGAIFNLLLEAIRDARQCQISMTILAKKVSKHGDEACKLLEKARDELIAEATGAVPGENVGPVLTPEAILIMLIERLVQGVYGTGSVEIISIYEECLELLVRFTR